jgi:nitrous oxidase accessory protein
MRTITEPRRGTPRATLAPVRIVVAPARRRGRRAPTPAQKVVVLLAGILVFAALATPMDGQRSLSVGADGDFATVAAALAAAEDGDTVRLRAGRYAESGLQVTRSVTILGDAAGEAVIDGEGAPHNVLHVTADGVVIRDLVIRRVGASHVRENAAIRVENAGDCQIRDNTIEDAYYGVYLARSNGCRVAGNTIRGTGVRTSGSGNGIHLWNARDVTIEGNTVTGHRDGIYLEFANGAVVRGNTGTKSLRYGLHLMFSGDTRHEDNVYRENGAGVAVMFSERVVMTGNRFEENRGPAAYGLLMKDLRDSEVSGNRFVGNTVALHSEGADRVVVSGNLFLRNGRAVRLFASSQANRFEGNDFVANAFDVTTNSRHHFNHFEGNYWSGYRGYDLTGDGFGDVPHRPVRLFGLIAERQPVAMVLLRSLFVDLLDLAERVIPALTPEALMDERPSMRSVT